MPKPGVAGGVCLACKFDPDCIYEAGSSRVILQCEQFQMGFLEPPARPSSLHDRSTAQHKSDATVYPGLCSNCDNRETCIYPKPEGGIWRCEEYV